MFLPIKLSCDQFPKLITRVRFPPPAPLFSRPPAVALPRRTELVTVSVTVTAFTQASGSTLPDRTPTPIYVEPSGKGNFGN